MDGTRVTVSKPGYDASNPPAVDYQYLALDSRLNQGRPLEIGLLSSYAFISGGKVPYSRTYPTPPAVDLVAYSYNPTFNYYVYSKYLCCRDANSSIAYQRSSWIVAHYTDGFIPTENFVYRHTAIYGASVALYYIAWQVQ